MRILVVGGYGVFGGYLSRLLIGRGHDVVVAGRRLEAAQSFCDAHGGSAAQIDLEDAGLAKTIADLHPDVVIDAAGPFQGASPAKLVNAALAAGAHYLDLSDDAAFTTAISAHDATAREADRVVLSGVSSVPAISSAAVDAVRQEFDEITLIDGAICPGNRAPRGLSVMRAILCQVGEPLRLWRGGTWRNARGWTETKAVALSPSLSRSAALIGAPDLALFPTWTGARSVVFRAGLELGVMHRSLSILSRLRRARLLPRLDLFTRPLHWAATLMERLGSDQGGMAVEVSGRQNGAPVTHRWTIVAGQGLGPQIPAIPALCAVDMLAEGLLAPGARAAMGDIPLPRLEAALTDLGVTTARETLATPRLFEAALPTRWTTMPPEWRRLHDVWDLETFEGRAEVTRGTGFASKMIAALFRFPPATADTSVTVEMRRTGAAEIWTRTFGRSSFRSTLSPAGHEAFRERFGPFSFEIALTGQDGWLGMQVQRGWLLGLPLPRALTPACTVREEVVDGRFRFDVDLSHPLAGRLVRYRGWLAPTGNEG